MRLAIETCAPRSRTVSQARDRAPVGYPATPSPICARGASCHLVAWMKVMSDQSPPLRGSAAAFTIDVGLPTTWSATSAPKDRASCQPVYGAPANAGPGLPARPSVSNWSRELK
jgi:hypothetical protein